MKKLILFLFITIMFISCNSDIDKTKPTYNINEYKVIEVDSCEYLKRDKGYNGYLAHKGNCKYCAERRKKEIAELIEQLKNE